MATVRVVTDSGADLDASVAGELGICVVPLDIRLGDAGPSETRTWSAEEFWRQCAKSVTLPETSAPAPGAFAEVYEKAASEGCTGVVCVTLSSKLSATYQAASAGTAEAGIPVRVVDSLSVTMGEGLLAVEAARAALDGKEPDEVAAKVEEARARIRVYGTLDTLDNLRKGGRIGAAQAFVGSLLSIKPVIEVRDGVVEPESRQRTRARSLEYLAAKVRNAGPLSALAVVHAAAPDVDALLGLLVDSFPPKSISVSFIGPVIGTHSGPGSIGVCYELANNPAGS
jgi:DegV family protein with EDD domain